MLIVRYEIEVFFEAHVSHRISSYLGGSDAVDLPSSGALK